MRPLVLIFNFLQLWASEEGKRGEQREEKKLKVYFDFVNII